MIDPAASEEWRIPPEADIAALTAGILYGPAPPLPGVDAGGELFPARGRRDQTAQPGEPLYTVRTIQRGDPPWIKLAYLHLDRASLREWLRERIALQIGSEAALQDAIRSGELVDIFTFHFLGGRLPARTRNVRERDVAARLYEIVRYLLSNQFLLPYDPGPDASPSLLDIVELWRAFQRLTAGVLWVWAGVGQVPLYYAEALATAAGSLYESTHLLAPLITAQLDTLPADWHRQPFDLAGFRKWVWADTGPREIYLSLPRPRSLAVVAAGLFDAVRTAGSYLALCDHCGRIFQTSRRKGHWFCSDYCRTMEKEKNNRQRRASASGGGVTLESK